MKSLVKKICFLLFLLTIFLGESKVLAKDNNIQYSRENISNYFLGIISADYNYNNKAIKHFKKVESLKSKHSIPSANASSKS